MSDLFAKERQLTQTWLRDLRDQICQTFHTIERSTASNDDHIPRGAFARTSWQRAANADDDNRHRNAPSNSGSSGGGGEISKMRGRIFEKVGVNISTVWGEFSEEFRHAIPGGQNDGKFWATGLSLVAHMRNPHVPAIHMNCRHIITTKRWFGGCIDLNPAIPYQLDTDFFHNDLRNICEAYSPKSYRKYADWCDQYFYLKHRQCKRGVGGIFFDQLNSGNFQADNEFAKSIGQSLLRVFPEIIKTRCAIPYNAEQLQQLALYRGRYAEFNMLYDRGTKFGIQTGANPDAVLMSLPPMAMWD